MSTPRARISPLFSAPPPRQSPGSYRRPLGRFLVDAGVISSAQLVTALEMQLRLDAPLGEILIAEGMARRDQVLDALSRQTGQMRADLLLDPPDPRLAELQPPEFWMRLRAIPWQRLGDQLVIATERPACLDEIAKSMPDEVVGAVIAPEDQVLAALSGRFRGHLTERAENCVAPALSSRSFGRGRRWLAFLLLCLGGFLGLCLLLTPAVTWAVLSILAVFTLTLITSLKIAGFVTQLLAGRSLGSSVSLAAASGDPVRLPKVSIMVPMFHETEIAGALVKRLARLTYPKALLDVILVLEEKDDVTQETLSTAELPPWLRVIEVPDSGGLTTKPRALNYALPFCRGDIIGVWDAEDAPAPDQIDQVVHHFATAAPDVACLQGILDYYNPRTNWIARCFTIEYASWWRLILPGLARLGFVVPLGGTTLFMRRKALEELGAWDAHNVTEDADLGVRLARFGYRTELISTVTSEEANYRPWPWIKQRSRWLKGFMITWLVHMRHPGELRRSLGWGRFLGLQAFFIGTLAQFLLAPVLWSFWLVFLGMDHPLTSTVPSPLIWAACGLFLLTELTNMLIGAVAVSGPKHRFLIRWVLALPFYFPLGAIASYKALYELLLKPFYWDKTQHGQALPEKHALPKL